MADMSSPSMRPSLSGRHDPAQRRISRGGAAAASDDAATHLPIDRVLDRMAGFYRDEADGRAALRHLRLSLGLLPSQLLLLGPTDARSRRFARLSRQWAAGLQPDGPVLRSMRWPGIALGGLLGGLLAGLLAAAWRVTVPALWDEWHLLAWLLPMALGAALGAAIGWRWLRPQLPRRFDSNVQRQLAGGCWALVAHGVPWSSQAAVVMHFRASSLKWCAVAPRPTRL